MCISITDVKKDNADAVLTQQEVEIINAIRSLCVSVDHEFTFFWAVSLFFFSSCLFFFLSSIKWFSSRVYRVLLLTAVDTGIERERGRWRMCWLVTSSTNREVSKVISLHQSSSIVASIVAPLAKTGVLLHTREITEGRPWVCFAPLSSWQAVVFWTVRTRRACVCV